MALKWAQIHLTRIDFVSYLFYFCNNSFFVGHLGPNPPLVSVKLVKVGIDPHLDSVNLV